jgi:hypothetical protein
MDSSEAFDPLSSPIPTWYMSSAFESQQEFDVFDGLLRSSASGRSIPLMRSYEWKADVSPEVDEDSAGSFPLFHAPLTSRLTLEGLTDLDLQAEIAGIGDSKGLDLRSSYIQVCTLLGCNHQLAGNCFVSASPSHSNLS